MGQDHRRLDSKVIAQYIFTMVKADPTISIRILQRGVENHFGYKASYRKVSLTKQRVITRIYGDWEESYNELPRWLFSMQMYLPAVYKKPTNVRPFRYLGATSDTVLASCIHRHCDVSSGLLNNFVDGHSARRQCAAVEGKTKEAWSFFLSYLREHVTPQLGVLVISDRHKSIDGALNAKASLWKPPHAFQAFCTRHIATNFVTHFRNQDLKKVLINAVYSKSYHEFAHYYGRLRGENLAITN
ncbi:uncharacterized protein LOC107486137 [Arachis duranensis]|uniref:Uncharacterized protein LOC107486137 n=1 Tax=Arachis duranensis TaxID=130453 RepID=A0A6P4DB65_ARADU|nr:uncharacterized protein LOC107486137 [Arachis duranensis]